MSKLPTLEHHFLPDWSVALQTMPATRLAYIRKRAAYYNPSKDRQAAFTKLIEWAKLRALWHEDSAIIGVCPDNPAITPPQFCQYDVGIAVEHGVDEDDIISIQTLPETTLATLKVTGPSAVARQAWRWFMSDWLPRSGLTMAHDTYYEIIYSCADSLEGPKTEGILCIPVLAHGNHMATPAPWVVPYNS